MARFLRPAQLVGPLLTHPPARPSRRCLPHAQVATMSQAVRDDVGTNLLRLTLKELFEWRFMQTDPNWCVLFAVF